MPTRYYLMIKSIPGESTERNYPKWIEVREYGVKKTLQTDRIEFDFYLSNKSQAVALLSRAASLWQAKTSLSSNDENKLAKAHQEMTSLGTAMMATVRDGAEINRFVMNDVFVVYYGAWDSDLDVCRLDFDEKSHPLPTTYSYYRRGYGGYRGGYGGYGYGYGSRR